MLKVLIVDDEAPIKDYIAYCIAQSGLDCTLCASVSSGAAALRELEKQTADVVLTDITMPRMDGLALLGALRARYPQTDVVMLTCHDDFSFARTAMQQGAADYLLKSEIDPVSMGQMLARVREKRLREHPERIVARRLAFEQYLREALADQNIDRLDPETLAEELQGYRLEAYFVCLLRYEKAALDELAQQRLPWVRKQWVFPHGEDQILVLTDLVGTLSGGEQNAHVTAFVRALQGHMHGALGVSAVRYDPALLKRAVLEARDDLSRAFYRGTPAPEADRIDNEEALKQLFVYRNNAVSAMTSGDFAAFRAQADAIFAFSQKHCVDAARLKQMLTFIAEVVSGSEAQDTVFLARITEASCLSELQTLFTEFTGRLIARSRRYSENIEHAVRYIQAHFRENITLQDAAGAAFLNTEYFSRRFKKEVGVNFSEYLLALRMKEARVLLRTTSALVGDVAEQVGIPNVSHFTSLFKKQFGTTPVASRKL